MSVQIFTVDNLPIKRNCVLAYGHFNSVHPGHIRYLKKAASQGEYLIVAILPDTNKGKKRSYKFSQIERSEGLTALNVVNGIILNINNEETPAVANLNPNVMPHWPTNPILHIIHNPKTDGPFNSGNETIFGTNNIMVEKK